MLLQCDIRAVADRLETRNVELKKQQLKRSWNSLNMRFLLLLPLFLFKFKWTSCSFKAVHLPAKVTFFMVLSREQTLRVCLLSGL